IRLALVKIFDLFTTLPIPLNSSDFALIDSQAVHHILACKERSLFLRGVRTFVGFKQIGVDYDREEGAGSWSLSYLLTKLGFARGGLLSFSNTPITVLSFFSVVCLFA